MSDHLPASPAPGSQKTITGTDPLTRFIGELLGTVCHDLNNHLATMNESLGLASDILDSGRMTDKEKLAEMKRLLDTIEDRLHRPAALIRHLAAFSRGPASGSSSCDISEAIGTLVPLLEKTTAQLRVSLRPALKKNLPASAFSPVVVQLLFFAALENLLPRIDPGSAISLSTSSSPAGVCISLTADKTPVDVQPEPSWSRQDIETIARLTGISIDEKEGGATIAIVFPTR